MNKFFVLILFLSHQLLFGQFNPHAGLIIPFTENAVITTSSGNNKAFITDRNAGTFWESDNPLPDNYIRRTDLNFFRNSNRFSSSLNLSAAVDGNTNTKAQIPKPVTIRFREPVMLYFISVKYQTDTPFELTAFTSDNTPYKFTLSPDKNFQLVKIVLNKKIKSITINNGNPFNLFELAALSAPPTEYVLFDFKTPKPVGQLHIRALNNNKVSKIEILGGNNPNHLTPLFNINPTAIPLIPYLITPEKKIRYLKIVFHLPLTDYYKVKLWEADAYDKYGMYGKPAVAVKSNRTYGESFGINAFWGWGYNVYSDELPADKGPHLFSQICKLVRNYHRLDWDTQTPQNLPDYKKMSEGKGTRPNPWLNWDREYANWKKAGFTTDASILFNNELFPDTLWKNPYRESYRLGKTFTTHFVNNKKLIRQIEVGNEPWGYNPGIYQQILSGFAEAAHQTAEVTILPCALQAYNPYPDANHYINLYLNNQNIRLVDGLNTHIYNYIFNRNGDLTAVNPEDPRAEIWSVANLQRYRNKNLPGKDIFVTEFGYDSDGGGETCTHTVCVNEKVQAIYGIRSALILQRLGVKQFYWYYFANVAYSSFLHNRAGLVSSSKAGFKKKTSFYAFKNLYDNLKNFSFDEIIAENNRLFAYRFSNNDEQIIILWIPTAKNHFQHQWVDLPKNINPKTCTVTPVITDKEVKIDNNRIFLSGVPVILKIIH